MPLVSVIMPVYNAERYVAAAVESILAQTFRDFEFLIVDDGSTDGSLKILRHYEQRDARIRLVSRPNTGHTQALNEMLERAVGTYAARMDADDISLPGRFAAQVEYLNAHPEVLCVGSHAEMMDEFARKLRVQKQPLEPAEIDNCQMRGHTSIIHPTAMMRIEAVRRIGMYKPDMLPAEDLELWLRLAEVGPLANVDQVLFRYRLHAKSISGSATLKQQEKSREICIEAAHRRGVAPCFDAEQLWRPTSDVNSRFQFMVDYGWWAFNSRERRTAIHYGVKALGLKPWNSNGWRLLICSILKTGKEN